MVHTFNRRECISGLIVSVMAIPIWPSRSSDMGFTALSGHRIGHGDKRYKIADLKSPDQNALLKKARTHAEQSKNMLQDLLLRENCKIEITGGQDRWGEIPVRLRSVKRLPDNSFSQSPQYLERSLIFEGACRVFPEGDDIAKIENFLSWENEARIAKSGLWSQPWYRVRNANKVEDTHDCVGSMQLVEGIVQKVGRSSGRWFLNFGDNYRDDVTITIAPRYARAWQKEGFSFENLEGSKVRARGFIEWVNGPSITLYHRKSLEILD